MGKIRLNGQDLTDVTVNYDIVGGNVHLHFQDGSPQGVVNTIADLPSEATTGIYVVKENGHWYYYNDGWQDGGEYQNSTYREQGMFVNNKPLLVDFDNKTLTIQANSNHAIVCSKDTTYFYNGNSNQIWSNVEVSFADFTGNVAYIVFNTSTKVFNFKTATEVGDNDLFVGMLVIPTKQVYFNGSYKVVGGKDGLQNGEYTHDKPILFDFINKTITIPRSNIVATVLNQDTNDLYYYDNNTNVYVDKIVSFSTETANVLEVLFDTTTTLIRVGTRATRTNNDLLLGVIYQEQQIVVFHGNYKVINHSNHSNQTFNDEPFIYPMYPVWGNEYLYTWYKKLYDNEDVTIVCAGDSTTQGANGIVNNNYLRHNLVKKILTLGGYDATKITSINAGHGGRWTGNWLSGTLYPVTLGEEEIQEYGYLDDDMANNPNLYILAYGFNDGSPGHHPDTTIDERVVGFESRMREGLGRIRTSGTFESGPSYNKSAEELPIIICMPLSTDSASGVNPKTWQNRIRPIIQRLCREFHCAFVDVAARQYDHSFSKIWSNNDGVHPLEVCNADYMSMMSDLIYPLLLHKS